MSDMASGKATALAAFAAAHGLAMTRFDYSGHGRSSGRIAEQTIGTWLEEAETVVARLTAGPQVLVGSSMGGWIALLLARKLAPAGRLAGLVVIAPAWDMTERLMWRRFSPDARRQIETEGLWLRPSADAPDGYPITRALVEEGRRHLLEGTTIDLRCPVRVIQGMRDEDVPWQGSLELVAMLAGADVRLTLVKDGEHRLSRPRDIALLCGVVGDLIEPRAD